MHLPLRQRICRIFRRHLSACGIRQLGLRSSRRSLRGSWRRSMPSARPWAMLWRSWNELVLLIIAVSAGLTRRRRSLNESSKRWLSSKRSFRTGAMPSRRRRRCWLNKPAITPASDRPQRRSNCGTKIAYGLSPGWNYAYSRWKKSEASLPLESHCLKPPAARAPRLAGGQPARAVQARFRARGAAVARRGPAYGRRGRGRPCRAHG